MWYAAYDTDVRYENFLSNLKAANKNERIEYPSDINSVIIPDYQMYFDVGVSDFPFVRRIEPSDQKILDSSNSVFARLYLLEKSQFARLLAFKATQPQSSDHDIEEMVSEPKIRILESEKFTDHGQSHKIFLLQQEIKG